MITLTIRVAELGRTVDQHTGTLTEILGVVRGSAQGASWRVRRTL